MSRDLINIHEHYVKSQKPCDLSIQLLWDTIRNSYAPSRMVMTSLGYDVTMTSQGGNSIFTKNGAS